MIVLSVSNRVLATWRLFTISFYGLVSIFMALIDTMKPYLAVEFRIDPMHRLSKLWPLID
jgi:hypothetical protein